MIDDPLQSAPMRQAMLAFAKRRGAGEGAEDAVQLALLEAWSKTDRPSEPEELRRWLWGILRHKLVDQHRRARRELVRDDLETKGDTPHHEPLSQQQANDLLRWASQKLPAGQDAQETLEWLLREAEGESLEHIAEQAALPPARVRKRVSRLRDHFRKHWQKEVMALAAIGVVIALVLVLRPRPETVEPIAKEPPLHEPERERAELEQQAHEACEASEWRRCLELLDQARGAGGQESERAQDDRARAERALAPAPTPAPSASASAQSIPSLPLTSGPKPKSAPLKSAPSPTPSKPKSNPSERPSTKGGSKSSLGPFDK